MKNRMILALCKLFQRRPHPVQGRILIVSTTALGDTLWATPAIESLKRSFPGHHMAVLTSPIGYEVLRTNPWIDAFFVLPKGLLACFALWRTLLRAQFDTVLIFHASQRIVFPLAALIKARQVVGTSGINKGLDSLLTHALPRVYRHEIARRLAIIEAIGAKTHTETLTFIPDDIAPRFLAGRYIALHPGSKDAFKRWPVEHFAAVGMFFQKQGYTILITGQPPEMRLMQELAALLPGAILWNPTESLHAFAKQLQHIALLICNDSGPMHLAAALHCKAVAVFCATDPHLCGPYFAKTVRVIAKEPTCTPCWKKRCREPFCLMQIGPGEVIKAASEIVLDQEKTRATLGDVP